ncbi:hypothetical protein [Plantibacter sp. YIM 135347]|uniref:hypothetical protein n=1 Tax=Plantibacter sp. YIM 135347 TaxID=3423919 RepID=UPI003D33C44F
MSTGDGWSAPGGSGDDGARAEGQRTPTPPVPPAAPAPQPQQGYLQQPPQYQQPPVPQYGQPPQQYGQPPQQYGQPPQQYGQPQYAQPAPQYGQPMSAPTAAYDANPYAQPGFAPGPQQQGWAPPPKPGLIPLRPLAFSDLFSAPFQVLRRNPKATFGSALLIQGIASVISVVIIGLVTWIAVSRISQAAPEDQDQVGAGATAAIIVSFLIPLAISIVGGAFLQGIIAQEVARATLGEKLRLGTLWKLTKGRFGALVGYTFLIIGAFVVFAAVFVGIGFAFTTLGDAGIVLAVLTGIAGVLVLIAAYVWIGTKISLAPSIIVLERSGVFPALKRSWQLTDRFFWRTFGIQFLVASVVSVVSQVVVLPVSLLSSFVPFFFIGTGDEQVMIIATIVGQGLTMLVSVVIGAVTIVITGSVASVIYIDLRMRKEGLDIDLTRFVEDRAAGRPTPESPYERTTTNRSGGWNAGWTTPTA